jgi:uncharacterized short protein YbdD (DUF466 family)
MGRAALANLPAVVRVPDYEGYLAHAAARHLGAPVLSRTGIADRAAGGQNAPARKT